jgi:Dolichyl-phosphate-mannose-protein mannosyltransferase
MTTATRLPSPPASDTEPLPRLSKPWVFGIAAGFTALELALSARYGFHRDELYFLACARHFAWGYVDQPPLVPAVAWTGAHLFGSSPTAIRVIPALAGGATVILTASMARELRGGRKAQAIAALAAATSPQVLGAFHLLSPTPFDMFFWAAICFVFLRFLRTGDRRLWLLIGLLAGVGLMNKLNVGFLLIGLAAGLVLARRGRVLLSPFVWAGAGIALVLFSPYVVWNAQHDWAALAMLHSLHSEDSGLGASLRFIPAQFFVVGPVLIVLWLAGLRRALTTPLTTPIGIACLVLLVLFAATGAKVYYLAGIYFALFALGGVWAEERLDEKQPARGLRGWVVLMLAGLVLALPLTLPVLPERALPKGSWVGNVDKDMSATVGWPQFAHQIADIAATLPAAQRAHLVVFTGDYGAAAAIDQYGAAYGLPRAVSGHNTYWWWGPAGARDGVTTIAVNLPRSYLLGIFSQVKPAGSVATPNEVWSEERGEPIWICTGQKISWAAAWPAARHYG